MSAVTAGETAGVDAVLLAKLRRRAVLVMHELDGVPVRDVAAALGIPLFTVYSRLRKARRELGTAVRALSASWRCSRPPGSARSRP